MEEDEKGDIERENAEITSSSGVYRASGMCERRSETEIRRETREQERRGKEARCKGVFGRCAEEEAGLRGNLPERELRQLGRSCSKLRYVELSNAVASTVGWFVRSACSFATRIGIHRGFRIRG